MRRLNQDVTALEIQPTIEDVFHADTSSVEEYLKQVEEATILAAIQVLRAGPAIPLSPFYGLPPCPLAIQPQEAQQDTVSSFEHFMDECMARDWAANKRQLFTLVAPHSGAAAARRDAAGPSPAAAGARLPPKEQAYISVIQQANQAAASGNRVRVGERGVSDDRLVIHTFGALYGAANYRLASCFEPPSALLLALGL